MPGSTQRHIAVQLSFLQYSFMCYIEAKNSFVQLEEHCVEFQRTNFVKRRHRVSKFFWSQFATKEVDTFHLKALIHRFLEPL